MIPMHGNFDSENGIVGGSAGAVADTMRESLAEIKKMRP